MGTHAAFLRHIIPQLTASGLIRLAIERAVELGQLEGRTLEAVVCEFGRCAEQGHERGSDASLFLYCEAPL